RAVGGQPDAGGKTSCCIEGPSGASPDGSLERVGWLPGGHANDRTRRSTGCEGAKHRHKEAGGGKVQSSPRYLPQLPGSRSCIQPQNGGGPQGASSGTDLGRTQRAMVRRGAHVHRRSDGRTGDEGKLVYRCRSVLSRSSCLVEENKDQVGPTHGCDTAGQLA